MSADAALLTAINISQREVVAVTRIQRCSRGRNARKRIPTLIAERKELFGILRRALRQVGATPEDAEAQIRGINKELEGLYIRTGLQLRSAFADHDVLNTDLQPLFPGLGVLDGQRRGARRREVARFAIELLHV